MSIAHYVGGVLLLLVIVAPPALAGVLARRRWSSGWDGATAVLADVICAIAGVILTAEITGAFDQFRRAALVITGFVVLAIVVVLRKVLPATTTATVGPGAATAAGLRSEAADPEIIAPMAPGDGAPAWYRPWMTLVSLLVVGAVATQWIQRSVGALGSGVTEFDSLAYHLDNAARFFQSGHLLSLNYIIIDPLQAFHPLNSELVQSIGMVAFRHDVLAPILNLGWFALLLLAGWCAGRKRGVSPLTLLAATAVVAVPAMTFTAPGAATSDTASLACWAAAVALLAEAELSPQMLAVAGLAAGLAVGSKLTVLATVGLLAVLVWVVLVNRRRLAGTVSFVVATLVGGGFWYVRNLIRTGNPLPSLNVGVLPSPNMPIVNKYGFAVTRYLTDGHVWREVFVPGLRVAFGDLVWLLLALLVAALVLAFWRGGRLGRGLAALTIISGGAYLATPLTAYGPKGHPLLQIFEANLRYVLPVVVVGLFAGLMVIHRFGWRVQAAAGVLLAITSLGALVPIAGFPIWHTRELAILVGLEVVLAVLWWANQTAGRARLHRAAPWAAVGVLAAGVVAGAYLGPRFMRRRYASTGGQPAFVVGAWASSVHHQKVGMINYPYGFLLDGRDFSNEVRILAEKTPHGGLAAYTTCAQWMRALDARHFDDVVIGPSDEFTDHPYAAWTAASPNAHLVVRAGSFSVYQITGPLDTSSCPS